VSVRVERDGAIAVVTVDNPPVNALGNAILQRLGEVMTELAENDEVRAVVLTGAGEKAFMAGADLVEFRRMVEGEESIEEHVGISSEALRTLTSLPQPVVAAVQAHAMGGGLEVALACDLIVADPAAKLGLPEVRLGLMPGAGGTQRLPRRIGVGPATELLLTGGSLSAEKAERLGLVNRVSAPGEALAQAIELAGKLARLPRLAVRSIKQAVNADLQAGLEREHELFLALFRTADVREGVSAFVEKREPRFSHK
jgi:enoyl-CoA hydratase